MSHKRKNRKVEQYLRSSANAIEVGRIALDNGNCQDAAHALAHAYNMRGLAEGYAQALHDMKGRAGSTKVVGDRRVAGLGRFRIAVSKACKV